LFLVYHVETASCTISHQFIEKLFFE
jgi:hypothetical protein